MTESTDKAPRKKRSVHEHLEDLRTQTTASLERIKERERVAREKLSTLVEARTAAEAELTRITLALGAKQPEERNEPDRTGPAYDLPEPVRIGSASAEAE